MAILHAATLTPTKPELLAAWLGGPVEPVGAFRFDDPEGRVGLETHLVVAAGRLRQVPLTYRDGPLDGAASHLVGTMEHSALGTRWVYDGLRDPVFTRMLAAVAMTGTGQAVGLVEHEGRWLVAPPNVRVEGGGWSDGRVPVDGFEVAAEDDGGWGVLANDRFELRVARWPVPGERPTIGLTATWAGQAEPVVLAVVSERA